MSFCSYLFWLHDILSTTNMLTRDMSKCDSPLCRCYLGVEGFLCEGCTPPPLKLRKIWVKIESRLCYNDHQQATPIGPFPANHHPHTSWGYHVDTLSYYGSPQVQCSSAALLGFFFLLSWACLLCWTFFFFAEDISSLSSRCLLCRVFFSFMVECFSFLLIVFLPCRALFRSAEYFSSLLTSLSSLSCTFALCWAFFYYSFSHFWPTKAI